MKARMLIRTRDGRIEFYAERGEWSDRGLPYVFRNEFHAMRYIQDDEWNYEVKVYDINFYERIKTSGHDRLPDAGTDGLYQGNSGGAERRPDHLQEQTRSLLLGDSERGLCPPDGKMDPKREKEVGMSGVRLQGETAGSVLRRMRIKNGVATMENLEELINALETTAAELLEREDENQSHTFAKGITFSVAMIKNFMKEEVEE